jgi:hypothetical protein
VRRKKKKKEAKKNTLSFALDEEGADVDEPASREKSKDVEVTTDGSV